MKPHVRSHQSSKNRIVRSWTILTASYNELDSFKHDNVLRIVCHNANSWGNGWPHQDEIKKRSHTWVGLCVGWKQATWYLQHAADACARTHTNIDTYSLSHTLIYSHLRRTVAGSNRRRMTLAEAEVATPTGGRNRGRS